MQIRQIDEAAAIACIQFALGQASRSSLQALRGSDRTKREAALAALAADIYRSLTMDGGAVLQIHNRIGVHSTPTGPLSVKADRGGGTCD